jgi:hypothetical protein
MCSGVISRQIVCGDLIGIGKIKPVLAYTNHGTDIERLKELIVQKTIRNPSPEVITVSHVLTHLKVQIGTRAAITGKVLVKYRGLVLQSVFLVGTKGIAGIQLYVQ